MTRLTGACLPTLTVEPRSIAERTGFCAFAARLRRSATAALLLAGLAATWHRTFGELWIRWFPAWRETHLTLPDRLLRGDSYYTHGPMVVLASLALGILVYRRAGCPAARTKQSAWTGITLLMACLCLHLMSLYASITLVSAFALIGALASLLLWFGGGPLLRAYAIPLALLVFMVPIPMHWIAELNYTLKTWATDKAVWCASHLFAVPSVIDGCSVYCAPDSDGTPRILMIENACSGLRNLIAMIWFGALFAATCRLSGIWRWLLLLFSIPLALLVNVFRIALLIVAMDHGLTAVVSPEGTPHVLLGIATFGVAMAILLISERMILAAQRSCGRDGFQPRLMAFLDRLPRTGAASRAHPMGPALIIAIAGFASLRPCLSATDTVVPERILLSAPEALCINDAQFVGEALVDRNTRGVLNASDVIRRVYANAATGDRATLTLVYSARHRRSIHPPEVCLAAAGGEIIERHDLRIIGCNRETVPLRELLVQHGALTSCYLYTYRYGDRYTTKFAVQQAGMLAGGLLGHEADGALIQISLPCITGDVERTRRLARSAAEELLPLIDQRWP